MCINVSWVIASVLIQRFQFVRETCKCANIARFFHFVENSEEGGLVVCP